MWIETNFGAIDLGKVRAAVVIGSSIRFYCRGAGGDADIPFGSKLRANEAYNQLMYKLQNPQNQTNRS